MPPKKNIPKKKITFEENNIDPKLKHIFPSSENKQKAKGGAKGNSDDSDNINSDSDSDDSAVEMEEHFDEIEDEDNLENDDEDEDDEDEKSESENDADDVDADENDECMYKFSGKKSALEEDDDMEGEEFYFEEDDKILQEIFVPNDKRITRSTLTKYEKVRVLGERAKQLSLNAKPMVKGAEKLDPKEIAKLELKLGVLPMIIIRPLPTGQKERWKVNELKIVN